MESNAVSAQICLVYRVLDANLNRLREALRVIEEYYRFINDRPDVCVELKTLRHGLIDVETVIGRDELLANRDSENDCFAGEVRPEEQDRDGLVELLAANFKRGQEASRVIEEYAKMIAPPKGVELSETAKKMRFALYTSEKDLLGGKR
jgi:thiamine-phosphate pyrophosphorylase